MVENGKAVLFSKCVPPARQEASKLPPFLPEERKRGRFYGRPEKRCAARAFPSFRRAIKNTHFPKKVSKK